MCCWAFASSAVAVDIEWENGVSGSFSAAANWNPAIVPGATDNALFNEPGLYVVNFSQDAFSQEVHVTAGNVRFLSNSATTRLYTLSTDGDDPDVDFDVSGGSTLLVGIDGSPVSVEGQDAILFVGAFSDGTLSVRGTGSEIDFGGGSRTHPVGTSGATGVLTVDQNAIANIGLDGGGTLDVGVSGNNASNGTVNVASGGQLMAHALRVGSTFTSAATGLVTVDGGGSAIDVVTNLEVGSSANGSGTVSITGDGTLRVGGTTTVNATGTINAGLAGDGVFNADGPVVINGGALNVDGLNGFQLAAGQTLTATGNGQVNFSSAGNIFGGSTYEINSGADLSAFLLSVGVVGGGDGSLVVDGSGSTVTAVSNDSLFGGSGGAASVTFRNQAVGAFAGVGVANSNFNATVGDLSIESDAEVTTGNLSVATFGTSATGTITVDGNGSRLTQNGAATFDLGSGSGPGSATFNVQNGGVFSSGTGTTTISATGVASVGPAGSKGTFNANGQVNVDGGTLTVGELGDFILADGQTLAATNDGQIEFGGSYDINRDTTLEINSGADLSTAFSLHVGRVSGDGELTVDGVGSTVNTNGSASIFGASENRADVTFRNQATGVLGDIDLANTIENLAVGVLSIRSDADVTIGRLRIATQDSGATGTVVVEGDGSTLTQTGASALTVGSVAGSSQGVFSILNGGEFTTGTGATTINATGLVNVGINGDGTFNANGAVNVTGGALNVGGSDDFNLAAGLKLTASSGGQVDFSNGYFVDNGTTFEINSGADLAAGFLDIGTNGDGALVVDGAGSTVTAGSFSIWGSGAAANATFRNGASAEWGDVRLADSNVNTTTGEVTVETGADVTMDSLVVATRNSAEIGTITVTGAGSTLSQNDAASLELGSATATGSATIHVENGGVFTTGTGGTTIRTSGTLNVGVTGGGVFNANGPVDVIGGTLTVGPSALDVFDLAAGQQLTASQGAQVTFGTLDINNDNAVEINSGADLFANSISVGNISGDGTLNVDGAGTTVTSASGIFWGIEKTANITLRNQAVGDFGLIGLANTTFNGSVAHLAIETGANAAASSISLATASSGDATATLTVDGAGSALTLKAAAQLRIGSNGGTGSATLNVRNGATLTTGTGPTTINATGTLNLQGGRVNATTIDHTAGGQFNFTGGTLSVETFQGDLTNQGGTLAPGDSAGATTVLGDLAQQSGATLAIELGGTAAVTEHDFVSVSGDVLLDGLLQLSLINGFLPDPSDTFTVLSAGNLTGFFDNATPGSRLDTSDGLGSFLVDIDSGLDQIVLSDFIIDGIPGDYNDDGVVDAADYTVWRDNEGQPAGALVNDNTGGVIGAAQYNTWVANFGATLASPTFAVPEPAALGLLALGLAVVGGRKSASATA